MLEERIKKDLLSFMKEGEKVKLSALRLLKADIQNETIKAKRKLADDEVISCITRNIKQIKESKESAVKANRGILEFDEQLELLERYLPEQLTEEEVINLTVEIVKKGGYKSKNDFGKVMKELMPKIKGKFDNSKVKDIVLKVIEFENVM